MQPPSQIHRRTLLWQATAASVGAIALPQIVPSSVFGADVPSNKLNLGIIGCGGRACDHVEHTLTSENIVALCDVDQRQIAQAKKFLSNRGVADKAKIYDDYRKLLEEDKSVDAVLIAPGQRWHVPMCKRAMQAGKHVYCEKPLAHSCAQARENRELPKQFPNLATQAGTQHGASETFRRSVEVIQAGVLGPVREVFCWVDRGAAGGRRIGTQTDPIPPELNWDFWCGPSKVLPFMRHYLGFCLNWGEWLEFGDGHMGDMGMHTLNLPWRALKLGAPISASVKIPERLRDSYPSATKFRWEFAARENLPSVTVWWADGGKYEGQRFIVRDPGVPSELVKEVRTTYGQLPSNGVLFSGEKGILWSDAWGNGGIVKLKDEAKGRGVHDHEACKPVPVTLPRAPGQSNMGEWFTACKGGPKTFQGFETAANVVEIAMVGMLVLRFKPGVNAFSTIEWDSEALKVKGAPEADAVVNLPMRQKWL
jgi:hypothetical protein